MKLSKQLLKKQTYPRAALRKEVEGKVRVEINVDREGNIVAHSIKSSSGHDVLDREVPKLLKRVSPRYLHHQRMLLTANFQWLCHLLGLFNKSD